MTPRTRPDLTPAAILTRELVSSVAVLSYGRLVGMRRLKQIARLQKITAPTDPIQAKLLTESMSVVDSMVSAVDKISKTLIRPAGGIEPPADTDSIMDELRKGRTPAGVV